MPMLRTEIISAIDAYMQRFQYDNASWYVGITEDPEYRLFTGHNVDKKNGIWIYEEASSAEVAREVENAYLDTGHDGGPSGGDDDSVYVYAFVKLQGTAR